MSADQAAKYEELIIESNDGSRSVDLRFGVLSFQYFEDVFSPTITARVLVQSSGGGDIEDFKGTGGTKALLQGLPIIGFIQFSFTGLFDPHTGEEFSIEHLLK